MLITNAISETRFRKLNAKRYSRMIVVFIPAAGRSSRMHGCDKLLEDVDGQPLLRQRAAAALDPGLPVIVALRAVDDARREALAGLPVKTLIIPNGGEGLGVTLSIGAQAIAAMARATGMLILPADMPDIDADDIAIVCSAFAGNPNCIFRAASDSGTPGHPVIFPRRCFAQLAELRGDDGARDLLKGETVTSVPLPGDHATLDLDTPEAWARWRKA